MNPLSEDVRKSAQRYLDSRRSDNRREFFSRSSESRSLDASSLHLDLARMLGSFDQYEEQLLQELAEAQDANDGFFHEVSEAYTSDHPRVREMAGTYLGFQIGQLFLKVGHTGNEFRFWRVLTDPSKCYDYIEAMPWASSPWGAGGWLDALATMLRANVAWGFTEYETGVHTVLRWVHDKQSAKDGLWGTSECQGIEGQINGAYHLLRGTLLAMDTLVPNAHQLMDTILDYIDSSEMFQAGRGEGCHDLDVFYLLYRLSRQYPEYRKDDVRRIAKKRLAEIAEFQNADGGFGFYPHASHEVHNYRSVGERIVGESDIQGTVFYLTAIKSLFEILDPSSLCHWKFSLTHG